MNGERSLDQTLKPCKLRFRDNAFRRAGRIAIFALTLALPLCWRSALADVAFEKKDDGLVITVDGKPFAVYVWKDPKTTRPYFKDVYAPGGNVKITRNHPPQEGDLQDHATYHPGIWWGFGDIGGNDYWRMKAKIIGGDFIQEPKGGRDSGQFTVRDQLLVNGGDEVFCEQISRFTIMQRPAGILLVCDTTFRRDKDDFWFGDQEEMGLGIRTATPIATVSKKGGRILNKEGSTELKEIRTKQSEWCDYSGPIAGQFGGIMLMNNPKNFRAPWWHAVDDGQLVVTPFAESELTTGRKKRQNVLVKKGEPFHLSYGALVHLDSAADAFFPRDAYKDYLSVLPTLESKAKDRKISQADLPQVPEGFKVSVFAQEPLVFKPSAMCFDAKGRLFVGQGPQYPENYENSPTDKVFVYLDSDHDGVADEAKEFATGFNSVQGLAWKGKDLYVANSPELTVVRDLDGDDVADEYVVIFTDLGNREHALHGLNWAPDGKLYMSKGNSKGHNQPEKYGYVAPRAFRELWDVEHPPGAPDSYPPKVYTKDNYRKTYHHWDDDWGRQGGVLRCDPLGANLEIVTRGLRNPWDITIDPGFNLLGTDNDQSQGDRIVMPFFGANFGWGHPYSSHWSGDKNLPTVPVSGPMFPGSGTGIVYYDHPHFPAAYRQTFILNDWLDGTFLYRPTWEGALMQPEGGALQSFIRRGAGDILYRPTDLEFGPDGSLYSCGWGGNYEYKRDQEGSWIFRISHVDAKTGKPDQLEEKRSQPVTAWNFDQLVADMGPDALPIWRVAAQDELVRRGAGVRDQLIQAIDAGRINMSQQTWAVWALGRMLPGDKTIDEFLIRSASPAQRHFLNLRLQAMRIIAHRVREMKQNSLHSVVRDNLVDADPRVRFEAVQTIRQADAKEFASAVIDRLGDETDRLTFYAGWGTLRNLMPVADRKLLLKNSRPRIRLAALLSLQEDFQLSLDEALAIAENETDAETQSWAMMYAMNPRPPSKMPNSTSRVELEQSLPTRDLIERANTAIDRPVMRRLYLKLMSSASFRSSDLRMIRSFYESLKNDDERALVLPPLTTSLASKDYLWDAFGGEESLQRAAVDGWQRMLNLAATASPSSEQRRKELGLMKETGTQSTNRDANAGMLASWLLEKLANVGPKDKHVASAVEVLSLTKLPPGWVPPSSTDATLAAILEQQTDTQVRSRILAFVGKIESAQVPAKSHVRTVIEKLCTHPDPRLYLALVSLTRQLQMDVAIPKLEAATKEGILSRLPSANVERGRELFYEMKDWTGCAACHRVSGRGNDFAPDLSGIGLRAKPEVIVESMLAPSATITEGYAQQILLTDDGLTITGVVLRETSAELTVFKSDRTVQTVATRDIVERQKSKVSAMPDGYGLFGNEQLADVTAYLLTLRHPPTAQKSPSDESKSN